MSRLASRRNRRAVSIQANPVPGIIAFTTHSVNSSVLQLQLEQDAAIVDAPTPDMLVGWTLTFWDNNIGGETQQDAQTLTAINGGVELTFNDLGGFDGARSWALVWPDAQELIRGYQGERLGSVILSNFVGTRAAIGSYGRVAPA